MEEAWLSPDTSVAQSLLHNIATNNLFHFSGFLFCGGGGGGGGGCLFGMEMRSTEPAGEELEIWGYSVYCIIDNIYSAEYILFRLREVG